MFVNWRLYPIVFLGFAYQLEFLIVSLLVRSCLWFRIVIGIAHFTVTQILKKLLLIDWKLFFSSLDLNCFVFLLLRWPEVQKKKRLIMISPIPCVNYEVQLLNIFRINFNSNTKFGTYCSLKLNYCYF